jgi:phage host-nuclease inhibitor protein Gam
MSLTTYELIKAVDELKGNIEQMLTQSSGEITETVESFLDQLEITKNDAFIKAQHLGFVYNKVKETESFVEGSIAYHQEQIDKLKTRRTATQNTSDRIKSYIIMLMNALEVDKLEIGGKNVSMLTSEKLVIEDLNRALESLPTRFIRVKEEVDKTALKTHIKNTGVSYDGVYLEEDKYLKGL